jgi:AcrR family transcriptional regulator
MSSPTLTRAQRQAETRAALLASAARLFRERGLDGTSVEQIARDAGYTKGAFYANFESKEDLFLAMLDERFAANEKRLESALRGGGPPAEEAREAAEEFVRFVWSDPEWPRLFFEFTAYAARNERFRAELAARYASTRERMVEVFRRWSEELPVEPPFPLEQIATMVFCMGNGFLMEQLIEPDLGEEVYGTMMATFFRGMAASSIGLDMGALARAQEAKSRSEGAGR